MRVKATVEYKGGGYAGWQVQPGLSTVQGELERALRTATKSESRVEGAGRTDAGVHARAQVAAFDVDDGTDLWRLTASLNGLVGRDIAVVSLESVARDFDPRRDARRRTYEYKIVSGRPRSPLLDDYAWHVSAPLDDEVLAGLAETFIGTHDFSAFRASDCEAPTTTRTVEVSRWRRSGASLVYTIAANAFLKNMVRVIVGTMVEVATDKLDAGAVSELLAGGDRGGAGRTAPAKGLTLISVHY